MKAEYDGKRNLAVFILNEALSREDFERAAATIDPHIEEHSGLAGLVIVAESFPGWESLGAFVAHMRFVHSHHRQVARVAMVTDSALGDVAEKVAGHFVSAQVKHFQYDDKEAALEWAAGGQG